MNYNLYLSHKSSKFLDKLNSSLRRTVKEKIELLKNYPNLNLDIKKMKGMDNVYRVRIGKIRFLFDVDNDDYSITIVDINVRGNIY